MQDSFNRVSRSSRLITLFKYFFLFLLVLTLSVVGSSDWDRPANTDYCSGGVCDGNLHVNGDFSVTGDRINITVQDVNVTGNAEFQNNVSMLQRLTVADRIGIGTDNPQTKLQIDIGTEDEGLSIISTDNVARLRFEDRSDPAYLFVDNGYVGLGFEPYRGIFNNGIIIKYDGKVGIGTVAPSVLLDVAGDTKVKNLNIVNGSIVIDDVYPDPPPGYYGTPFNFDVTQDERNVNVAALYMYSEAAGERIFFGKSGHTVYALNFKYVTGFEEFPNFLEPKGNFIINMKWQKSLTLRHNPTYGVGSFIYPYSTPAIGDDTVGYFHFKSNQRDVGVTGKAFVLDTSYTRTAGKLLSIRNNGVDKFIVDYKGNLMAKGDINAVNNINASNNITVGNNIIVDGDGYFNGKIGIGTNTPSHELNVLGSANITGNITAQNVFLPAFIFAHSNTTFAVASAGVFYNITFDMEISEPKLRMTHTHNDGSNDTFTIVDDGYYTLDYSMTFSDDSPSPTAHIVTRITKNDVEIHGSLLEQDATRQYADFTLFHASIDYFVAGDKIRFQFASDDTDVSLTSHRTYGDHDETAVIRIIRIA